MKMQFSPETNKKLMGLLVEYGNSLTRIDGEKTHCQAIARRATVELGLEKPAFIKLATAYHRDTVEKDREALNDLLALFESAKGIDKIGDQITLFEGGEDIDEIEHLAKRFNDVLTGVATMTLDFVQL